MQLAERIYREGVLPSGAPLHGIHPGGGEVTGAQAACVMCHRRSGLGTVEGTRITLPITGRYLYQTRPRQGTELADLRRSRFPDYAHALGRNRSTRPYTDDNLVRAIRQGVDVAGEPLDPMMPRFNLSDTDARMLVDYLKQLSRDWSPGVSADSIDFATVITPDVAPQQREELLAVLNAFFEEHNAHVRLQRLFEQRYPGSQYKTYRTWWLHVWDLTGAPEGWRNQLDADYRKQPVFALLSGLSQGSWTPVHGFCEQQAVPCWFPTVDLPVVGDDSYYPIYFSGGVELEARLLGHYLSGQSGDARLHRVIQVHEADPASSAAAQTLADALQKAGIPTEQRLVGDQAPAALHTSLAAVGARDALVLWLRGPELQKLNQAPPGEGPIYVSAILSGGEDAAMPAPWKQRVQMVYPFELPQRQRPNMAYIRSWLKRHNLEGGDERVRSEAFLACRMMSEKLDEIQENLYRDYLMETTEDLISRRRINGIYHNLSLGPGQRLAAKGGYIVRFAEPTGSQLVAETDWIVP